jgi:hypothetical protein
MSDTSPAEHTKRRQAGVLAIALGLGLALSHAAPMAQESQGMPRTQTTAPSTSETLTDRQQAIVPIAALRPRARSPS